MGGVVEHHHVRHVLNEVHGRASGAVPEVIHRSWRRCLEDYALDPSHRAAAPLVSQQCLREHRERVEALLGVARAGLEQLYSHVAPHGYALLLSDDRGIAVDYLGDLPASSARRTALYLGADWSEPHSGTSAVGTCLAEGQALTCHGADHFYVGNIGLTCTSAPLFGPDGAVMAALDVSAARAVADRSSQNFALQLVLLYARMIEDAYFLRCYRDHPILRFSRSREMVQLNGEYLVALADDGTVAAANTRARALITSEGGMDGPGRTPEQHAITELFDCDLDDVLSIPTATDDATRAFRMLPFGAIYFATLIEPKRPRHHAVASPTAETDPAPALDALGGDDPTMRKTIDYAKRLRNEPVNLLIVGETGTGKECVARAVHDSSERSDHNFIAVNCAAIPESLIESELFGYRPGTFTGARNKGMTGLIQQADGGTLLLDEIGDMPLNLQTRLLRALAENAIMPLGAERPIPVDLRVIAATHQSLHELIRQGQFREDLYYRLDGATLHVPPVRCRADSEYIIRSVFDALCRERGVRLVIRGDAMSALLAHDWPGNIRELGNALRFAIATRQGDEIRIDDLPDECRAGAHTEVRRTAPAPASANGAHADHHGDELQDLLRRYRWNVAQVARVLGVSRPTVYRRMRHRGIVPPHLRE